MLKSIALMYLLDRRQEAKQESRETMKFIIIFSTEVIKRISSEYCMLCRLQPSEASIIKDKGRERVNRRRNEVGRRLNTMRMKYADGNESIQQISQA